MKDILLVCAVAAIFGFGCFVMKKLDVFLDRNRRRTEAEERDNSLLLAFENPMIISSLTPLLEDYSKKHPDCQLRFFFGTAKEISDTLAINGLDFAFVNSGGFPDAEGYNCVHLSLCQGKLLSEFSASSVKPLISGEIQTSAIWQSGKCGSCREAFADLLVVFSNKNQKQAASR